MAATQVTTRQIKDSAVTTSKIADTNVTFAKLNTATNPGLEDSTGIRVKVNTATMVLDASGISVKDDGIGAAQLGILTTKGDLIGFSTLPVRVGVGSDGQVLVADSAQSSGLAWSTLTTGFAKTDVIVNETPSGTVNGTNPTFTLANTPESGTVAVHVNGLRQKSGAGNDYTISGSTITFESGAIPLTGDVILVDYLID